MAKIYDNSKRVKILEVLALLPDEPLSISQISDLTGISKPTVRDHLSYYVKEDIVKKIGNKRFPVYTINTDDEIGRLVIRFENDAIFDSIYSSSDLLKDELDMKYIPYPTMTTKLELLKEAKENAIIYSGLLHSDEWNNKIIEEIISDCFERGVTIEIFVGYFICFSSAKILKALVNNEMAIFNYIGRKQYNELELDKKGHFIMIDFDSVIFDDPHPLVETQNPCRLIRDNKIVCNAIFKPWYENLKDSCRPMKTRDEKLAFFRNNNNIIVGDPSLTNKLEITKAPHQVEFYLELKGDEKSNYDGIMSAFEKGQKSKLPQPTV